VTTKPKTVNIRHGGKFPRSYVSDVLRRNEEYRCFQLVTNGVRSSRR
jgi:hypothetical protein